MTLAQKKILCLLHPKEQGSHNLPSAAKHEEESPHFPHPSPSHTSGLARAVEDLAGVTGEAIMDDQCWDSEQWEIVVPGATQPPVLKQQVGRQRPGDERDVLFTLVGDSL